MLPHADHAQHKTNGSPQSGGEAPDDGRQGPVYQCWRESGGGRENGGDGHDKGGH